MTLSVYFLIIGAFVAACTILYRGIVASRAETGPDKPGARDIRSVNGFEPFGNGA